MFSKEAARQSHPTKQFTTPEQVNIVLMHLQSRGFLNHKNKIKDTLKMSIRKFRMIKEDGKDKAVWDSIGYIKVFEK